MGCCSSSPSGLESALEGEIADHLGYDSGDPAGNDGGNSRNGTRAKTVLTEVGPVEITVPRDRDGSFEPQIVKKRQRRLSGVEDMVISLSAKGLTTGEIQAHLAEVYGAEVSRQTISTITDRVIEGMTEWQNRPLDPVYPVVFLDAVHVKIRDGKVANRPMYLALAVTVEGTRDILGLWAGDGGEGAKFCCRSSPSSRTVVSPTCAWWSATASRACPTRLVRRGPRPWFRPASSICSGRRFGMTVGSTGTASPRLCGRSTPRPRRPPPANGSPSSRDLGGKYPAIVRLWEQAWAEFVPFLAFDTEIRTVVCSTNAIESVNARIRRAVRARGHFPNEAAALKCVYLAVTGLDPTGQGRRRWTMRWKPALNAFEIAFEGRVSAGRK